jgi:predicted amidohydrolase
MKPISRRKFVELSAIAAGVAPIVAAEAGGRSNAPSTIPATAAERQTARDSSALPTTLADSHRKVNSTVRIGHCQLESRCGDFEANLAKVVQGLERADREHVEIICFPECFLTGYPDTEAPARKDAFAVDSPSMLKLLERTSQFEATYVFGFNERRGQHLYNTAAVIHQGRLLGRYSKCSAYQRFHRQGREFPVFERNGVKFGVVICSDGGYIEPSRILALNGAKIIFSPHYNYISKEYLLTHFQEVRADHVARAVENRVYFVRGNNVSAGLDPGIQRYEGVGYGDSYIVDPYGEIVVRSRRHREDFIFADIDPGLALDNAWQIGRSRWSFREFGAQLVAAAGEPSRG